MWGAYNGIAAQGFEHNIVNNQFNFVNPNAGVTTDQVEAIWQRAKAKSKSMSGTINRNMIPDYLAVFIWNQRFKEHSYFHFWTQGTEHYCMNSMVKTWLFKIHRSKYKIAFLKATNN